VNTDKPVISLDRTVCNDLQAATQREWLITNGIGGYAMGTVAGIQTRGYHGLLIAALDPPVGRFLLLNRLEEAVTYRDKKTDIFTNSWQPDTVQPEGYRHIESFRLDGTTPVWTFRIDDALLEKRIWMQKGENTTYIRYTLLSADQSLTLDIKTLIDYRGHHARTQDTTMPLQAEIVENGLRVTVPDSAPFYILSKVAEIEPQHSWYENLYLRTEAKRGTSPYDSSLMGGIFHVTLQPHESLDIVATTEEHAVLDATASSQSQTAYEDSIIQDSVLIKPPNEIEQLLLAADQFLVQRKTKDDSKGCTVIAGYPWFGDWGRDTMISLPGLTLTTGRPEAATKILRTFAQFIDQGMLPNRFPDTGETPEYNTVDATLWYFQAIRSYYKASGDLELLHELFPKLVEIIEWHVKGTRHQIHIDPIDHLLYAGESGTQLTWMDAKYGNHVVTPRIGKPVEVNALWFNVLKAMAEFSGHLDLNDTQVQYQAQAEEVAHSFKRFWNEAEGFCYDVLDGPNGHEALLRPNQIFAVSLPYSPLSEEQQKSVVDVCSRSLLTPFGLRSLAADQPGYIGHYTGDTEKRDSAYHQGTVWAWLIGPFVEAHLRIYKDQTRARDFLQPLLNTHLQNTA
jgi:predicted glycogen debranching enzyme